MTTGGLRVTNGWSAGRIAWLAFFAVGFVYAAVNALSVTADRASVGRPVPAWEPWSWELTSLFSWLVVAPFVFAAASRLRSPEWRWPAILAVHAAIAVAASLAHVGLMNLLREAIYAAGGGDYRRAAGLGATLLYEFRKDAITYALLVALYLLIRRLAAPAAIPAAEGERRIEVRDGARTLWLAPSEVDWAQAAGNYVELHGAFGSVLHRRTLAALEQDLGASDFRRIHRSRIVRAAAIRSVTGRPGGEFDVELESGAVLAGSRRFRGRV